MLWACVAGALVMALGAARAELIYGIQHRHTMRGLPELYEGVGR